MSIGFVDQLVEYQKTHNVGETSTDKVIVIVNGDQRVQVLVVLQIVVLRRFPGMNGQIIDRLVQTSSNVVQLEKVIGVVNFVAVYDLLETSPELFTRELAGHFLEFVTGTEDNTKDPKLGNTLHMTLNKVESDHFGALARGGFGWLSVGG